MSDSTSTQGPSGGNGKEASAGHLFAAGSTGTSSSRTNHAAALMAELASAKTQEQCLVQILSRCSHILNKLKVEELQLQVLAREEKQQPGSAIHNGVISPSSFTLYSDWIYQTDWLLFWRRRMSKKSAVWAYFSETSDPNYVKCTIRNLSVKLKKDKTSSTKPFWAHLEASHKMEYRLARKETKESEEAARKLSDIYVVTSDPTTACASTSGTELSPQLSLASEGGTSIASTQSLLEVLLFDILRVQAAADNSEYYLPQEKRTRSGGFFADLEEELCASQGPSTVPSGSTDSGEPNEEALRMKAREIVDGYMRVAPISTDTDPLAYWGIKEKEVPGLATLAKKLLSAPMGSVASEREFKVASNITSGDRTKMLPENAERMLFLKYNLRALGYNSIRLPLPVMKQPMESNVEVALETLRISSDSETGGEDVD